MLTASTSALVLLLVSACADDQQASEADPSADPDTGSSPDADPDSDSGADSAEEEEEDEESAEPIPASADGPAQNWPEPELPDEIYEETEEGAEALLHYWWEVLNHARITGDTDLLEQFSTEGCVQGAHELDLTRDLFDVERGWWGGESAEVRRPFTRLEEDGFALSVFELYETAFDVYLAGEHEVSVDDALTGITWIAHHAYLDGSWIVDELYVLNPEQVEDWENAE
ncbi:DUF6318 family protein [Nesterenkonia sp. NBAIMH1]|uniref:DUF6318 family protein n=1 Tax=Nesterenkonia sp. NBAIMH1 TaxID=2600320 RepID=UPI0011B3AA22|nr:DUF6318 family protein [Nesterenkonia sp. NBAIMH1]